MSENNDKKRSRRRGVRTSKVKLTDALTAAGLKSRAALAERMADLEGLEAAPRDVVYRVFRQQPVDLRTAARVARALGVPVHSLLLSSAEVEQREPPSAEPAAPTVGPAQESAATPAEDRAATTAVASAMHRPLLLGGAVVVLASIALLLGPLNSGDDPNAPDERSPPTLRDASRDLSDVSIVVRDFRGEAGSTLAGTLREVLASEARVASAGATAVTGNHSTNREIAERLGADVLIDGEILTAGRHVGLRVSTWTPDGGALVWSSSHGASALTVERRTELMAAIVVAIRRGLASSGSPVRWPRESAHKAYLQGRHYVDQSRTELNVTRAISRFEAALRDDPDYAEAQAGLCEALVQESLIGSDRRTLPDAERACMRAEELAPELRAVRLANSALARRTGRLEEAHALGQSLLEDDPNDVDALLGMAETALASYRSSSNAASKAAAVEFADRANAAEPTFWKAPFTSARIHFLTGNIGAAIAAGEAAVAVEANVYSLTNLGTSYFCGGNHEKALERYLLARQTAPSSSLGDEQICVAQYFAREFDNAVTSCSAAIDATNAAGGPAQHEMWANLADAYRQGGNLARAADAYARAAELAERKLLTQGASPNDRAHLAYYYSRLRSLDAARVPDEIASKLETELTDALELASDPQAFIRIASALPLFGRIEQARLAYEKGTQDCPGFGASPDLDAVQ